jgi:single-stranded-DNA-specific exonuclease
MPADGQESLSRLTRQLFADNPEIDKRLSHLDSGAFFHPQLLADVAASAAWQATEAFLERVIADKLPVLLFGDYDVDGSTACFLLFRWLRGRGASGNVFLPSRFRHGYGLDAGILQQAADQGYKALIALDCGTANLEEIALAKELGMEVLVIDHHSPKENLPDCVLLNPHLLEGLPPLCTAGLVLMALQILSADDPASLCGDEIELAGLATLADIVPLVPESWFLVHQALRLFPETANHGLSELLKISQLHGIDHLTSRQLAFQMIPRLNASGRMRSARLILDLFGSPSRDEARSQARQLDLLNTERRDVTDANYRQAARQALSYGDAPVLVLFDADWHIGVVGIVAARIAEQFRRPALVLTGSPQDSGLLSGSARSYDGISLVDTLGVCSEFIHSFGGHAAAAGVKLRLEQVEEFREAWSDSVSVQAAEPLEQAREDPGDWLKLPALKLAELSSRLEDELWQLAPFDKTILPAPRCRLEGVHVARCSYMGKERTHLNLLVTDGERQVRVAAFNKSHLFDVFKPGQAINPVVELEPDNWNNQRSVMLRLIGLINNDGSQTS